MARYLYEYTHENSRWIFDLEAESPEAADQQLQHVSETAVAVAEMANGPYLVGCCTPESPRSLLLAASSQADAVQRLEVLSSLAVRLDLDLVPPAANPNTN